ncbi:xaa-Pro aminopeptidase 3 isoform X4 [Alligator sinensis]|uniref:Xaa-Pro aminopeptidase 3 isoform X4 n=1 Tax=Alligator sinensis TaxID=38654 RepID=A0A3Q0H2X7_ALLSI|nr:xaa-Pro aminopeptidase 3 isoform X4 [Alligator sinensis]
MTSLASAGGPASTGGWGERVLRAMAWLPAQRCLPAARGWRSRADCKFCFLRRFSIQPAQQRKIPNRYLGQPSPFTHPHLLKPGEVTPGLSQVEYALRRHKLMSSIQKEAKDWGGESNVVWYDYARPVHPQLHSEYLQPLTEMKTGSKNRIRGFCHLVQNLRLIKSSAEIERMKVVGRVTSQAFTETMFASKSPVDEAFLYAKFEFECRARGADILAYPPVVAGGNRSNTLHYVKNNQLIKDGEMVLLDGGCESSCYVSDITRTWPINGRFTGPQAELYQAVLEVQKSCLSLCSPGVSLENIYNLMLSLTGQKLRELGVLRRSIDENHFFKAVRKYCPHHVGHYLGMDVHDTPSMSRSLPLQPGMVITIEPGIYIPEDDLAAPKRFRGIGIRIEDDVVVTEDTPLILSADCPKEIYHIEQICGHSL